MADSSEVPVAQTTLKNLIQSLGLPQDRLSASLLGFIRYFSLPQDAGLLTALRGAVLTAAKTQPGKSAANMRGQEALSLAAAAAESKGLGLDAEALREYAAAIDPDGGGGGGDTDGDAGGSPGGRRGGAEDHRRENPRKEDPEAIREAAEKAEGERPLLGILNRLPGKDGSRWIALPFTLDRGGRIIKVSVRALLTGDTAPFTVERLGIDAVVEAAGAIAVDEAIGKRRWLFFLDRSGRPGSHAELRVDPPLSPPLMTILQKELAEALGPLAESVKVSGGKSVENSGFAADCRDETLLSVDRAV